MLLSRREREEREIREEEEYGWDEEEYGCVWCGGQGILRRRRRSTMKTMKTKCDSKSDTMRWAGWEAKEVGTIAKMITKATNIS